MKPLHITFTGVDAHTDLNRMIDLSEEYPCEWGILFSHKRQGNDIRYPARHVIDRILDAPVTFAAHLCGSIAANIMNGDYHIDVPLTAFDRVQVNHVKPLPDVLEEFSAQWHRTVIGQSRSVSTFPTVRNGVEWLYDPSGGNGLLPEEYPSNQGKAKVGYAGGINPDNVVEINEKVKNLSPAGYWLDMESGVRTDDKFDLDKVEAVLKAIYG